MDHQAATENARIRELMSELDTLVPREGGVVRIQQVGGGPDESFVSGNRLGYLRLGVEFLKAAYASPAPESRPHVIEIDDSVLDDTTDVVIQWFERREDIVRGQPSDSGGGRIVPLLIGLGCLSAVIVFGIGLVTLVEWFRG